MRANGQPAKLCATKRRRLHRAPGGEQVVGALGAEPVGQREVALEVAQVDGARQRGELVDDHLGLGLGDRLGDRVGVERVGDDRPRAKAADEVLLLRRARHAHDVMPVGDELRGRAAAPSAPVAPATKTFMASPFVSFTD